MSIRNRTIFVELNDTSLPLSKSILSLKYNIDEHILPQHKEQYIGEACKYITNMFEFALREALQ